MKCSWIFYCLVTVLIPVSVSAQNEKIKFHSIHSGGIVAGEREGNAIFQSVNGIDFLKWYLGAGVGLDNYNYTTLPLFFDARRFFGKENRGFGYVDLGYNFPLKNTPGKETGYYNTYHFRGGLYTDFGLGYKTKFIKRSFLLFSLGHSYKELQTKTGVINGCPGCEPYLYNYKFNYGRIALKAGAEF